MTDVLVGADLVRRCRLCGCTDLEPCPGGCGWLVGELDLCDGRSCHLLVLARTWLRAFDYAGEHDLPDGKWGFVPPYEFDRYASRYRFPIIARTEDWKLRIDSAEITRVLSKGLFRPYPDIEGERS